MENNTSLQQQLLEAGVHFGHLKKKWNPKMLPYIFAEKKGIHIIGKHILASDIYQDVILLGGDRPELNSRNIPGREKGIDDIAQLFFNESLLGGQPGDNRPEKAGR